jgi:ATP-dependent helicase/nuclease subunit A
VSEAFKATVAAQRVASDPAASAFVAANAGAGKTRVLIDRVARLLLAGAPPSRIVCITFTKAAAAEMADRLFRLLGGWSLADDETLNAALDTLEGARAREAETLRHARRLFARALETPGGLKIQTIHAFCESILKRFPREAGAPPGFAVLDDAEARALGDAALTRLIERAARDSALSDALGVFSEGLKGDQIRERLLSGIGKDRAALDGRDDASWSALRAETARVFGIGVDETSQTIEAATLQALDAIDLGRARDAMRAGGKTANTKARDLEPFFASTDTTARFESVRTALLKADDTPYTNKFPDKPMNMTDPCAGAIIADAQAIIAEGVARRALCLRLRATLAHFSVMRALFEAYAAEKRRRGALDFEDLIQYAARLLSAPDGVSWVHYKLDEGVDHVLLDEAQDTSPAAWRVIERLIGEFFSGAGGRAVTRTFFAVGDQKQSIYSFQGADAALFEEKRQGLGKSISAATAFVNTDLSASFRSTPAVLSFVDTLFAPADVVENVHMAGNLAHIALRDGAAGRVEIWPTPPAPQKAASEPWDAPLDYTGADDPRRALPRAIARRIRQWLDEGALRDDGARLSADDILILVQSRSPLFFEMIRALGEAGVPVAGADRGELLDEQAALDLLSFARAALYRGDDLSLAETLRTPFFDIDEEGLMALAKDREGSLADALDARAGERPEWAEAAQRIAASREIGLAEGPLAFLSSALEEGAPCGWRRLAARLGPGAREPAEEMLRLALRFEQKRGRSLRLFISDLLEGGAEIKRETSEAHGVVRVMTAHKAKGLEAPIVFLLDPQRPPKTGVGPLVPFGGGFAALTSKEMAVGPLRNAYERARDLKHDEYRRLLYVAATRAKDRLYICGVEDRRKKSEDQPLARSSWRALAERAIGDLPAEAGEEIFGAPAQLFRSGAPAAAAAHASDAIAPFPPLPDYLSMKVAPISAARRLSPSRIAERYELEEARAFAPDAEGLARGRAIHRALELLSRMAPESRVERATALMRAIAPEASDAMRAEWSAETLRTLADPVFAPAFAPNAIAEAGLSGRPRSGPFAGILIDGRMDRLSVGPDFSLAIDFKTNRPPPRRDEDTPDAYLLQMAAYRALLRDIFPQKRVLTALLWTYEARLQPLSDALLDAALAKIA